MVERSVKSLAEFSSEVPVERNFRNIQDYDEILKLFNSCSARDYSPNVGQYLESIPVEINAVLNCLKTHEDYLCGDIQYSSGKVLERSEAEEVYTTLLSILKDTPVDLWNNTSWNKCAESSKDFEGKTFTYAMWEVLTARIWIWKALFVNIEWPCIRTGEKVMIPVDPRISILIPCTIVINEQEVPSVAWCEIFLSKATKENKPIWKQLLPYIVVGKISVGEKVTEQVAHGLAAVQPEFAVENVVMGRPERRRLSAQKLGANKVNLVYLKVPGE